MLIDQIKNDQLIARKASESLKTSLLTTLIGEAEMIGKNDGNRQTTNSEVIAVIKKFINNADLTIAAIEKNAIDDDMRIDQRITAINREKHILGAYLPKQLGEEELTIEILRIINDLDEKPQMGIVMKMLKISFDGQYDGKLASSITKQLLA